MEWIVEVGDEFEPEFDALPEDVRLEILSNSRLLKRFGPQLGRPRVDTLNDSRHANMKELRFDAAFRCAPGPAQSEGAGREETRIERKEVNMTRNIDDIINELGPAQRKKVEARAAQLIAEEMTLRQLRRARKLTQQKVAKSLRIGQEGVSKLEQRSDLLISTLRDYVEAMGGNLSLIAEFPDTGPVVLTGIAEEKPDSKPHGRKRAHAHA